MKVVVRMHLNKAKKTNRCGPYVINVTDIKRNSQKKLVKGCLEMLQFHIKNPTFISTSIPLEVSRPPRLIANSFDLPVVVPYRMPTLGVYPRSAHVLAAVCGFSLVWPVLQHMAASQSAAESSLIESPQALGLPLKTEATVSTWRQYMPWKYGLIPHSFRHIKIVSLFWN